MPSNNPLSRGYAAIEAALSAWVPLGALVKLGNGLGNSTGNLQTSRGRFPLGNPNSGERPAITLMQGRFVPQPFDGAATSIGFQGVYPLTLKSGEANIDKPNQIAIEVVRALTNAGARLELLPPDKKLDDILLKWVVPSGQFRRMDPDNKRQTDWTLTLDITLSFQLSRAAFLAATFT